MADPPSRPAARPLHHFYRLDLRPFFLTPRTYQRTIHRPGEICQFDLWEPKAEVPVGHGQTRRAWVIVACLATRAPAPAR